MSQAKEKLGTKRRRIPVNEKSDTGIIWKKQNLKNKHQEKGEDHEITEACWHFVVVVVVN